MPKQEVLDASGSFAMIGRTSPDHMRYMRFFILAPLFLTFSVAASGQTLMPLDSFSLAEPEEPAAESSDTNCLMEVGACDQRDSGPTFSLDDVVNLGIIDRSEISATVEDDPTRAVSTSVPLPSIDLEILFDYDSDRLRSDQLEPLRRLASELRGVEFGARQLVILGHTDAAGSAEYNQALSQRRARSVAEFLIEQANLPAQSVRAAGLGFTHLKYPENPTSASNRRVQVLMINQ